MADECPLVAAARKRATLVPKPRHELQQLAPLV
jgi:hypothetical protein